MGSNSTYDYKRIGGKQLRLCKFLVDGPEISAKLKTVPFEDKPQEKYFALSYSWEENTSKESHYLPTNQKPLRISASLKDFVDGLRSKARSDSLQNYWWVDSICINQDDSIEKTQQVQRMRDIYQHAHEVVVWLGKESGSSGRAHKFIEALNIQKDRPPKSLREEEYRHDWEDLKNFFDRAWWTRVWTVQECSIPSKLNYWCGSHTISRKAIFRTLEIAYDIDPPGFNGSSAFNHAWNRRRAWQIHDRIRNLKDEHKRVLSLPTLAAYFCNTEVTYDRDRIYGFAALATETFNFEPDFNSSTDDVYLRFARSFIDYYKSLNIIIFASLFDATPGSLLPSWVPDWRRKRQPHPTPLMITQSASTSIGNLRPPRYHKYNCKFSASGDTKARYGFDITKLLAWGCVVDEVDEIAGSHNGDRTANPQVQFQLSDAAYSTESALMGICRCLTLNRHDRYLRKPMREEWFNNDFIQLCLHLNHGFSLPNPPGDTPTTLTLAARPTPNIQMARPQAYHPFHPARHMAYPTTSNNGSSPRNRCI